MTQPKTLLEMAGAAPASVDPADAAVVMIDCQREYLDGHLPLVGVEAALAEGARLVAAARSRGIPVFHVQHRGRPGGLFDPEGPSFAIVDAVAPRPARRSSRRLCPTPSPRPASTTRWPRPAASISWSPAS